jgi:hypothetical protein
MAFRSCRWCSVLGCDHAMPGSPNDRTSNMSGLARQINYQTTELRSRRVLPVWSSDMVPIYRCRTRAGPMQPINRPCPNPFASPDGDLLYSHSRRKLRRREPERVYVRYVRCGSEHTLSRQSDQLAGWPGCRNTRTAKQHNTTAQPTEPCGTT